MLEQRAGLPQAAGLLVAARSRAAGLWAVPDAGRADCWSGARPLRVDATHSRVDGKLAYRHVACNQSASDPHRRAQRRIDALKQRECACADTDPGATSAGEPPDRSTGPDRRGRRVPLQRHRLSSCPRSGARRR